MQRRIAQHQAESGECTQAIGVSRGGRATKTRCLADACGRVVAVALTPGNIADISIAIPLLDAIAPTKRRLADKAYDADRLRSRLGDRRIEAVNRG